VIQMGNPITNASLEEMAKEDGVTVEEELDALKAVHKYCLENCDGGGNTESAVAGCDETKCSLHPFRTGEVK
jgi:hypothetical protein